jgi:hypothetical protein
MNSKSQFAALEVMCRERAALARTERESWEAEAEEWRRLVEAPVAPAERTLVQLDDYSDSYLSWS